jgi:hypothetical protein
MTQSIVFHHFMNVNKCMFCLTLDGLEEWGDDAVLNQVLAVSQHEYLNSLMQQQQQQQGDTQNKVI